MKKRFKKTKITIISLFLIVVLFLGWYSYRLISADLLTDWYTPYCINWERCSTHYVMNSKNGSQTYLPRFLLPLVRHKSETITKSEIWSETITKINSNYSSSSYISGLLDENTMIFTRLDHETGRGYDIYKYNIKDDKYEVLMHDDNLITCVAGHGKIFYATKVENNDSNKNTNIIIYEYFPTSNNIVEIGKYYNPEKELNLETVLK